MIMKIHQQELLGQEPLELEGLHKSPIICAPFVEPQEHWDWNDERRLEIRPVRRPAGYYYKTERVGTGQMNLLADENWDELTLVNLVREDVKRWRESNYKNPSPTNTTRKLLEHWFERPRERPFFFCQREAVETLIFLAEMRLSGQSGTRKHSLSDEDLFALLSGEKPSFHNAQSVLQFPTLIDAAYDRDLYPLALRRAACKMATGSGKTVVMALLIAWSFCNAANAPGSEIFPSTALVCAPNLTVKERLQVLRPDMPGNFYETFDIVPPDLMPALRRGRVVIENWHTFAPASPNREGGSTSVVVNKGPERPDDLARRVLGEGHAWPILVFNDEGHHCWRPAPPIPGEGKVDEAEKQEATVWISGLDSINNARQDWTRDERTRCSVSLHDPVGTRYGVSNNVSNNVSNGAKKPGIALCFDLSATPFYIAGSGHHEGSPFPWIVSDFGLTDAIESGIVKIPRVPVSDVTGRPEPRYFRLWKTIHEQQHPASHYQSGRKRIKPEIIYRNAEDALIQLAGEWKRTFDDARRQNTDDVIPPVLIVVCDNTDLAQLFYEAISGEKEEEEDGKKITRFNQSKILDEFLNTSQMKRTIRIDSKLLAQAESDDPKIKKPEAAEALRRIVATVGRRGEPGEWVRCVVSVSMLTEGWDANNVTHILGVRAFHSQLLCEQVVGRGLRRISYEIDPETGRFGEEYADVYGIPFSVVPYRGKASGAPAKSDSPLVAVRALPERKDMELRFPNVEGYAFALRRNAIKCDVAGMETLPLDPLRTPSATFVAPVVASAPDSIGSAGTPFKNEIHNRETFYNTYHLQTVKFWIAQEIVNRLTSTKDAFKHRARVQLFPVVLKFVEAYVGDQSNPRKINFKGCDPRDIWLDAYRSQIVERLAQNIEPDDEQGETPLLPILNRFKPIGTTTDVHFVTQRPVRSTQKSHLSAVVGDTESWEQAAATQLEISQHVLSYARNDRLGLRIPYEFEGIEHFYEPDFLVELSDHKMLLLEIKGYQWNAAQNTAKHDGANRWVRAVNKWISQNAPSRIGEFNSLTVCKEPQVLGQMLDKLSQAGD